MDTEDVLEVAVEVVVTAEVQAQDEADDIVEVRALVVGTVEILKVHQVVATVATPVMEEALVDTVVDQAPDEADDTAEVRALVVGTVEILKVLLEDIVEAQVPEVVDTAATPVMEETLVVTVVDQAPDEADDTVEVRAQVVVDTIDLHVKVLIVILDHVVMDQLEDTAATEATNHLKDDQIQLQVLLNKHKKTRNYSWFFLILINLYTTLDQANH